MEMVLLTVRRSSMTKSIPEEYHSVTPIFVFKNVRKAIEFYKRAFGAQERFAMPGPDGKGVMQAEVMIGNSIIMMGEETPEQPCKSAETLGGSPVSFYIYLENVDEAFRIALEAGAEVRMPVQDMFWGDRAGTVQDPFGYSWFLATHIKDLTMQEIQQGAEAAFAEMAKK
jgi:PhnB protein